MKHLSLISQALSLGVMFSLLSGCPSPNMSYLIPTNAPRVSSGSAPLSALITGSVVSTAEAQLRDNLKRQIELNFPIRVGIVYYNYQTELKDIDQQVVFKQAETNFKKSDLVKETVLIPSALLGSNASVEQIRQLAARFQTEVIVVVTGENTFGRAPDQNLSFFDSFSDKAFYESASQLDALALDVFTGTFLTPFSSAVKEEPQLLDPAEQTFQDQVYNLKKISESKAWDELAKGFIQSLQSLKTEIESRPQPTPSPDLNPEANTQGDKKNENL